MLISPPRACMTSGNIGLKTVRRFRWITETRMAGLLTILFVG